MVLLGISLRATHQYLKDSVIVGFMGLLYQWRLVMETHIAAKMQGLLMIILTRGAPENSQVEIKTSPCKKMARTLDQLKCICTNVCRMTTKRRSWKP